MTRRSLLTIVFAISPLIVMPEPNTSSSKNPAEVMRELRIKVLTTPASKIGVEPSKDFPRVYTVLMDWPLGTNTISVYGSCTGDASIYTTSTFGVIGGVGHDTVRAAAHQFVKIAEKHHDDAVPAKNYPYPKPGHIYFYLVCFDGVRMIEADEELLRSGKHKLSDLGNAGQRLITELRLITEKKP